MKKIRVGAAALAVGVLCAATSAGADEVQFSWTGFHFGAGGGYGGVNHQAGFEVYDYSPGGLFQVGGGAGAIEGFDLYSIGAAMDFGGQGAIGTIEAGFDFQPTPRFVMGVFGDVTFSGITSSASVFGDVCYEMAGPDDCDVPQVSDTPEVGIHLNTGTTWTVGARAGFLVSPRTLLYGLVAYSRFDMNLFGTFESDPTGEMMLPFTEYVRHGTTFGAGIETMLTDHISGKLEYRGTIWNGEEIVFGDDTAGVRVFDTTYVQTVRGVLSYHFGTEPAPEGGNYAFNAEPFSWTGFYVGTGAGYGVVNHEAGFELYDYNAGGLFQAGGFGGPIEGFDLYSIGAALDFGGMGGTGTMEAGFDLQIGDRLVAGVFGDYTFSNITTGGYVFGDVCYEEAGPDDCDVPQVSDTPEFGVEVTAGPMWSLGGRVGFLATPRTMVYGLAAYTRQTIGVLAYLDSDPTGFQELLEGEDTRDAVTIGAGIETMLTDRISAKIEYRATMWTTDEIVLGDAVSGVRFFNDALAQTVRGGISFRFSPAN